jgi:hypothetical protein
MKQSSGVVDLGDVKRGEEGDAFGLEPPAWLKSPATDGVMKTLKGLGDLFSSKKK